MRGCREERDLSMWTPNSTQSRMIGKCALQSKAMSCDRKSCPATKNTVMCSQDECCDWTTSPLILGYVIWLWATSCDGNDHEREGRSVVGIWKEDGRCWTRRTPHDIRIRTPKGLFKCLPKLSLNIIQIEKYPQTASGVATKKVEDKPFHRARQKHMNLAPQKNKTTENVLFMPYARWSQVMSEAKAPSTRLG